MNFSKYNREGYYDPTAYEAFTNIEAQRRAADAERENDRNRGKQANSLQ